MYQQKMCYIDLYKNGLKCGNMGHVRLEWEDGRYRFGVNLCRLDKHTLVTAVVKRGRGEAVERISDIGIFHGKGSYQSDWMVAKGDEEQLVFEASGGVYGVCALPQLSVEEPIREVLQETAELITEPLPQEISRPEDEAVLLFKMEQEEPEPSVVEATHKSSIVEAEPKSPVVEATREPATEMTRDMLAEIRKEREALAANKLMENKWDQLCSMYEVVRPVDGDIEFIKIKPEDFVILRQEYQGLVRNSFLLHGYYNYRYILLGKYPDKYYIGVPGIMHEQERMAAAMFGFIGFERAVETEEEKKNFGYYMMEVAI